MIKAEWGHKRTCPKCATRFYDLGRDDPIVCISCGMQWLPEPVLKSKQPMPFETGTPARKEVVADEDLGAEDLAIDEDEEVSPDEEVDISTGDEDLGLETNAGEDEG